MKLSVFNELFPMKHAFEEKVKQTARRLMRGVAKPSHEEEEREEIEI